MGRNPRSWTAAWCHGGIVVLSILSMTLSPAGAAQYNVGDAAGWGLNVNYTDWASKYTFHAGDTIVFSYARGEHDVLQVSADDYDACKGSNPIATDASGQTSVVLQAEPYYFICGFPAHCDEFSQKVSFRVAPAPGSSAAPSEGPSETPSDDIPYTQAAETPIAVAPAYGPSPTGAFAFGGAAAMSRPSSLQLPILLVLGVLLGSYGSVL